MKNRKTIATVIAFLFLLVVNVTGNFTMESKEYSTVFFDGNILYVGGNGPNNYTKIQDAIDNTTDGDVIFIYNGIYYETLWVNKSISIIGEDSDFTIIDGQNENNDIISVNASSFTISEVTIQNNSYFERGIILKNVKFFSIIKNCKFLTECGIHIASSKNVAISNCFFDVNGDGISLNNANNCTISDCRILMYQFGININRDAYNNTVNNCEVLCYNDSIYGSLGLVVYAENNKIFNSSFRYCLDGLNINGGKTLIQNCTFNNNQYNGISLNEGNYNNIISHCRIQNNGYDGPLGPGLGIEFFDGSNNLIDECTISNNSRGGVSLLYWAPDNIVTRSTIEYNGFSSSNGFGIQSYASNKIYLNNIIGNHNQASDHYSNSEWDNGIYGNFWSDYRGLDWNRDAVGDKPYPLFNNSYDNFPLLCPYNPIGPSVLLERPAYTKGDFLYLRNMRLLRFPNTVLIGNIYIKTRAVNYDYPERIKKVEFYVDDVLRKVDFVPPYNWCWRLSSPLKCEHIITVIAYDKMGRIGQDSCQVNKIM